MKIIIVTQNEPFFIPIVINSILDNYKHFLDAIVFQEPTEFKNIYNSLLYYSQFWGICQFLKFSCMFITKSVLRKRYKDIKIINNMDINSKTFIDRAKEADYIISIASNQFFCEDLLNAPRVMCLNIHAGPLPKFRGYNPAFWVLYHDEKSTGVTLHKIVPELDAGPILIQKDLIIDPKETWFSLQNRVAKKAAEMLIEALPMLEKRDLKLREQDGAPSKFRKPKIEDGKEFRKLGKTFI